VQEVRIYSISLFQSGNMIYLRRCVMEGDRREAFLPVEFRAWYDGKCQHVGCFTGKECFLFVFLHMNLNSAGVCMKKMDTNA
jgi:hypothetical protein